MQKKSNSNEIQAFQNITLGKTTNAPFFVSSLTLHEELGIGIKTVIAEAEFIDHRFFVNLENHPTTHLSASYLHNADSKGNGVVTI